eukprot:TRINITY_DN788_c0_g2_i3.p1 TRINITY_DN788_c0_g2~~TRINITY_DN788_c0_g2_i3.p1  ORF type:complete len:172 (+),score=33.55 TRINITY_DN788_c0_g2_i3:406-921(+)
MSHGKLWSLIGRFYKKADLEQSSALTAEEKKFMADAEVFEVNAKSRITSKQITGKCYVWSIEEYDEEPRVSLDVFYTRGKYDLFLVNFAHTLENHRPAYKHMGKSLHLPEANESFGVICELRWMSQMVSSGVCGHKEGECGDAGRVRVRELQKRGERREEDEEAEEDFEHN